ncbi:hypothetical protein [Actinoplanes solisilvae]|uniref:hypothetical protein n=1 Tax=Actinoplanes solisilvae TaxID=2486853 RepID=UPI00196AE532|nr:hypothetical protein [Actinoplanes solisilvae]
MPRLIGVALAYLPAVWLILAVAVLAVGWLPRSASVVAWIAVAYCAVVTLFADSFGLPGWTQSASPFAHTPQVPLETLTTTPLLLLGAATLVLLTTGYLGLRRRDVGY